MVEIELTGFAAFTGMRVKLRAVGLDRWHTERRCMIAQTMESP